LYIMAELDYLSNLVIVLKVVKVHETLAGLIV